MSCGMCNDSKVMCAYGHHPQHDSATGPRPCHGCVETSPNDCEFCRTMGVVPAPQPPADGASERLRMAEQAYLVNRGTPPAGPPVTGDGDEAVVQELVSEWTAKTWVRSMGRRGAIEEIARQAYAAGARRDAAKATGQAESDAIAELARPAWESLGGLQCDEIWEALKQAVAAGLARGRALGAREEQLACAEAVRAESLEEPNPDSEGDSAYGQAILDALAAIARRAGRGT